MAAAAGVARLAAPRSRRRLLVDGALLGLGLSWLPAAARSASLPSFSGGGAPFVEESPKEPAPSIRFLDDGGHVRSLDDFAGRVLLVNIWATWCPPCVGEMPALDRMQRDLGGSDLQVVPISIDRPGAAAVLPFYQGEGIAALPVFLDPVQATVYSRSTGRRPDALPLYGLPVSFFVDRRGRLVGYLVGAADWDADGPRRFLRHLAGPSA
ncbi:TlpA family protein disulfide reductase [Tistlia consotensis]|uniref:TlpA family protein disulfide reductase n=1 Tax=Tistlia consotensis TaxID=1321365 RepID=UPI00135671E0|nr:TlpA disulfide reductase family protein [Tistlia consotensis]